MERLRRVDGAYGLDENWIRSVGASVIAQETIGRIDEDQALRFVEVCGIAGVRTLIGVANDDLVPGAKLVPAMSVKPTVKDIVAFDRWFVGGNALLYHPDSSLTWLGTNNDFAIFAGRSGLLSRYEPALSASIDQFRDFATTHLEVLRPTALRALDLYERFRPGASF